MEQQNVNDNKLTESEVDRKIIEYVEAVHFIIGGAKPFLPDDFPLEEQDTKKIWIPKDQETNGVRDETTYT